MSWVDVIPKAMRDHPSFGMTTAQDIRDLFALRSPFENATYDT